MQTEELRAELTELANEVDAFDGDLPAIRRRVARRRVASASVAIVVIAAVAVGAVALTRSNPNRIDIAHSVKEVGLSDLPRFDAAVVLPAHATTQDVAHVQSVLDDSTAVLRYSTLPVRTLAFALSMSPSANIKALRGRVCADPSTRSFAVELSRSDSHAERHLEAALGTNATLQTMGRPFDVEVFMQVHATTTQVATVRQRLELDPAVSSLTFISHQDAYDQFKQEFADQPELIRNESPAGLPESFRITLRDDVRPAGVAQNVRGLPGVDQVTTATKYSPTGIPGISLQEICSSKIHLP